MRAYTHDAIIGSVDSGLNLNFDKWITRFQQFQLCNDSTFWKQEPWDRCRQHQKKSESPDVSTQLDQSHFRCWEDSYDISSTDASTNMHCKCHLHLVNHILGPFLLVSKCYKPCYNRIYLAVRVIIVIDFIHRNIKLYPMVHMKIVWPSRFYPIHLKRLPLSYQRHITGILPPHQMTMMM